MSLAMLLKHPAEIWLGHKFFNIVFKIDWTIHFIIYLFFYCWSNEIVMASSIETSTVSKSACTILIHEDLGRPFDRHSRDQKATNIRTFRHPYNMTKERDALDDRER